MLCLLCREANKVKRLCFVVIFLSLGLLACICVMIPLSLGKLSNHPSEDTKGKKKTRADLLKGFSRIF